MDLPIKPQRIARVGSRVTCNPAPTDTDEDWLLLVQSKLDAGDTDTAMGRAGWTLGGSEPTDPKHPVDDRRVFWSYTKGDQNLIITQSLDFYDRFMAATSIAKRLNLMTKADRIALFQAVLYGNPCS